MSATIEELEIIIRSLSAGIEDVLKKLHHTSAITEKEKLAAILNSLSSSQKNVADTVDALENVNYLRYGIDDDQDEDFFDDDEYIDTSMNNRIEFRKNGKKKKRGNKNGAAQHRPESDGDLPF